MISFLSAGSLRKIDLDSFFCTLAVFHPVPRKLLANIQPAVPLRKFRRCKQQEVLFLCDVLVAALVEFYCMVFHPFKSKKSIIRRWKF